jgi:hypothetical protein
LPALPVVPNVCRLDLFWSIGNNANVLNRVHVGYSGSAPNAVAAAALAQDFYNSVAGALAGYTRTTDALTGCQCTDLSSSSGGQGAYYHVHNGVLTGAPLPADAAMVASMKIGRRYRGGKPRTYFPLGDSTEVLDAQHWSSAFVGNIQTSLNTVAAAIPGMVSGGCNFTNLVNVSYYSGFTVVTSPTTGRARNVPKLRSVPLVDNVLGWTAENVIGSQRRRLQRQP